jgi:hypothetical protein
MVQSQHHAGVRATLGAQTRSRLGAFPTAGFVSEPLRVRARVSFAVPARSVSDFSGLELDPISVVPGSARAWKAHRAKTGGDSLSLFAPRQQSQTRGLFR